MNRFTFEYLVSLLRRRYYGEFHVWQPVTGWTTEEKEEMQKTFKEGTHNGVEMIGWGAEGRNYKDFDKLHSVKVLVWIF